MHEPNRLVHWPDAPSCPYPACLHLCPLSLSLFWPWPCHDDVAQTEVLKAIAAIWPNQAMDVPRLKQVYLEHLAALGQTGRYR